MSKNKPVLIAGLSFTVAALTLGGLVLSSSAAQEKKSRDQVLTKAETEKYGGWCGTEEPTEEEKIAAEKRVNEYLAASRFDERGPGEVRIPVWVHVIRNSSGQGDVSLAAIRAQIKVLNLAYSGQDEPSVQTGQVNSAQSTANTPFRFVLAGVTRTENNTWFTAARVSAGQTAMKQALRRGGPGTLNLYLKSFASTDTTLGYATFPQSYTGNPLDDGVVCRYTSIPQGGLVPYDYGDTATHEVGHWFGLYHTFQGGCSASTNIEGDIVVGDGVADTPPEATEFYGMPTGVRDTCTTLLGRDPVENFMDYTDDDGMYQFTPGQSDRMDTRHATFRSVL